MLPVREDATRIDCGPVAVSRCGRGRLAERRPVPRAPSSGPRRRSEAIGANQPDGHANGPAGGDRGSRHSSRLNLERRRSATFVDEGLDRMARTLERPTCVRRIKSKPYARPRQVSLCSGECAFTLSVRCTVWSSPQIPPKKYRRNGATLAQARGDRNNSHKKLDCRSETLPILR
jgi:hypothetical protein